MRDHRFFQIVVGTVAAFAAIALRADYDVEVTGGLSGSVWGSGPYTNDSALGPAAVHAGLLSPGQTGLIRVHELPGQSSYTGSTAHGVTTSVGAPGAPVFPWSCSVLVAAAAVARAAIAPRQSRLAGRARCSRRRRFP
ncbi:MAG: hypothetical protein HY736_25035 [Verrucomicrobia bacterium]|nr:hypothetical protein [Verrucomicrobiota bacterium]